MLRSECFYHAASFSVRDILFSAATSVFECWKCHNLYCFIMESAIKVTLATLTGGLISCRTAEELLQIRFTFIPILSFSLWKMLEPFPATFAAPTTSFLKKLHQLTPITHPSGRVSCCTFSSPLPKFDGSPSDFRKSSFL